MSKKVQLSVGIQFKHQKQLYFKLFILVNKIKRLQVLQLNISHLFTLI